MSSRSHAEPLRLQLVIEGNVSHLADLGTVLGEHGCTDQLRNHLESFKIDLSRVFRVRNWSGAHEEYGQGASDQDVTHLR